MDTTAQSRAGLVGVATGVTGALSALVLLLWSPQVADDLYSYPFTVTGFLVVQGWFAVHHLGLVALLVAVAISQPGGSGRVVRAGGWVAVAGMLLLTGTEVLAMRYADWDTDAANAGLVGSSYGVACTAVGLGMLAVGVGAARAWIWSGWRRLTPLAVGVSQFVVLTPGLFAGFTVARLAIGFWMLTFAALGWSVYVEAGRKRAQHLPERAPARTSSSAVA